MEDILRRYSQKIIFVQYPLIKMKMKNLSILLTLGVAVSLSGCSKLGKSHAVADDGQLHGVFQRRYNLSSPRHGVYPPRNFSRGGLVMKISTTLIQPEIKKYSSMDSGWMRLKLPITNTASLYSGYATLSLPP
jgi:hypothetical protein